MNAVWLCPACAALHLVGEAACRRCAAPRAPAERRSRAADTEPVQLSLPPVDFPYSRTHSTRGQPRAWLAPFVFLALALLLAVAWDPFVYRFAAARALGGDSPHAERARRDQLGVAVQRLDALLVEREAVFLGAAAPADDWRARVRRLAGRYHIDGDVGSALGPLEIDVRGIWLLLLSLPSEGAPAADIARRIQLAKEEISRVTEDLSHAR